MTTDNRQIVYINQPDFYHRTQEDEAIIARRIDRYLDALGRCDDHRNEGRLKAWAKAFNAIFRDYEHMLAWHKELADKYGIVLHYKRGAIR